MQDARKTKAELIAELERLRERLAVLQPGVREGLASAEPFETHEEALRATLDSAADGILAVDTDGKVVFANKRFADLWHIPPDLVESGDDEELLNFVLNQLQDPDEFLTKVRDLYHSPRDDFDVVHFRDGRIFERFSRAWARGDALGGRVWSFRDVTKHHLADKALRESEERYKSLFEQNPDGVYSMDLEGNFVSFNKSVVRMSGYSVEELANMTFEPLVAPESIEETIAHFRKTAAGEPQNYEMIGIRKDGVRQSLNVTCLPIVVEGKIVGVYGIAKDITRRKRAEEERNELGARLEETQQLKSLGMLAGAIAHDFSDLLMTILGGAELALSHMAPAAPARPNVQQIRYAAKRATELCEQILAYSGQAEYEPQSLNLNELVQEIAHLLEAHLPATASLELNLAAELPEVHADSTQLTRALGNLVKNAAESLGGEGGVVTIATGVVECDRARLDETCLGVELPEGTYVHLDVADSGCGMDAETRRRAVEPFFTTKPDNRGLGLSAVLGIMREHKGALCLKSDVGVGTTVRMLFPRENAG